MSPYSSFAALKQMSSTRSLPLGSGVLARAPHLCLYIRPLVGLNTHLGGRSWRSSLCAQVAVRDICLSEAFSLFLMAISWPMGCPSRTALTNTEQECHNWAVAIYLAISDMAVASTYSVLLVLCAGFTRGRMVTNLWVVLNRVFMCHLSVWREYPLIQRFCCSWDLPGGD